MAITPVPSMTPVPHFPALSERAAGTYNASAYAFGTHMADTFNGELIAVAESTEANAQEAINVVSSASTSATNAANSAINAANSATVAASNANAAAASAGGQLWVSGTTYAVGALVFSALTGRNYRRLIGGAGTTDPSLDSTNWRATLLDVDTGMPTIRPSLLLDFANSKTVDPRITFTRASTATHFDAQGLMRTAASGVPRVDHDPVTGECKGLLIEEARTNLFNYSEQFDNAYWAKTRSTITANSVVAPDGNLTADTLVGDGTGATYIYRAVSLTQNTTYTCSIFFQAGTHTGVFSIRDYTEVGEVMVNMTTLTVTTTGIASKSILEDVGGGRYRLAMVFTPTIATGNHSIGFANFISADNVHIWGAQLEVGSFPTSYIPTTSAAVTRAAEIAEINGTSFSDFHNPREFTLYAKYTLGDDVTSLGIVQLVGTTGADNAGVRYSSGSAAQVQLITNGVGLVNIAPTGYSNPGVYSRAFAVSGSSANQAINGVLPSSEVTGTFAMPALIKMQIGSESSSNHINGHIARFAYYPKRLSNAELQALTAP